MYAVFSFARLTFFIGFLYFIRPNPLVGKPEVFYPTPYPGPARPEPVDLRHRSRDHKERGGDYRLAPAMPGVSVANWPNVRPYNKGPRGKASGRTNQPPYWELTWERISQKGPKNGAHF